MTPGRFPRNAFTLLFLAALLLERLIPLGAQNASAENAPPAEGQPLMKVGQWNRFEAEFINPKPYEDPYADVDLSVTYRRPDGSTVAFWGFYDGGLAWRLRFMPDLVGLWEYEARFSDGTRTQRGRFECVPSALPGMLSVYGPNPLWFGFKGGKPLLIRGLHVGDRFFAKNWDDPSDRSDGEKRAAFLDWAQQQGYNLLSVGSHYLNRDAEGRGRGWETPKLWPLDAAEYRVMEAVLDDLAARRISIYPFAGFFGRNSNFPPEPAAQVRYIKYTLARAGAYWNLLLNVAGPEPILRGKPYLTFDQVNRLGTEIRRWDVFGRPLSVHNATGDDAFKNQPWLTYGTLQGPKTLDRLALSRGLLKNHHPEKPLLAQETLWSGNVNHIRANKGDYSDEDLRKNAFVLHMSAAALVFADNDGDSSSGFSGTMDLKDRKQARHEVIKRVWDFLETVPWHRMKPRQDLLDPASATNAFCLAEPGKDYLIYLSTGGEVNVRVEGGPFAAEWINARDPSDRKRGGRTKDGRKLASPPDGEDWLLRLTPAATNIHP